MAEVGETPSAPPQQAVVQDFQGENQQIKTLGYNFDKNIEQNIEILIERARMLLNEARLSRAGASSSSAILNAWGSGIISTREYDLRPAAEILMRASSLLENLLFKAPDFPKQQDWQKENKELGLDIKRHLINADDLYGISEQLKDLTLRTAKVLGMVDQNIQIKRWERFLLSGSKSKHFLNLNSKGNSTQ